MEYLNIAGSYKDRIAYYMIKNLIKIGLIKENDKIAETFSGDTTISISWISKFSNLNPIIL